MSAALVSRLLDSLRHQKLTQDIAYSMGSFVVLAVSGIVINIVVTALRDAAALGVFNLAYAVYIVVSQFAVWGIHYSVLRHAAYHQDSPAQRGRMLLTATSMVLVSGLVAAILTLLAEPLMAQIFSSEVTGRAIRNAAWGLLLFPLNKVLLAYLNGLRHMRAFSILQALRYLTLMALVSAVAASDMPIENATFSFLVAEAMTAAAACAFLASYGLLPPLGLSKKWVRAHFLFGSKGLMAGMFAEVNSRIDVLMIGYFLSDRATGIYSFAAMLADGLYHVLAMVRINFNPMLVAAIRDREWAQARRLRDQSGKYVLPCILALSVLLVVAFYVFTFWVMPGKGLLEGLPALLILVVGINIAAVFVPFDNLMMVSGHPGYQAAQQLATVVANAVAAALLLPVLGIEGAAVGTALSYVCGIIVLVVFSRRLLGWELVTNTVRGTR